MGDKNYTSQTTPYDRHFQDQFIQAIADENWNLVEHLVDKGVRHKNSEPFDYLYHWLRVGRLFGYATRDGSFGEFEKEFAIIIRRLCQAGIKPIGYEE